MFHPNDKGYVCEIELDGKYNEHVRNKQNLVAHLLHMSKYILPAVKHTLALLCVQAEDKVCGVVGVAFLISE